MKAYKSFVLSALFLSLNSYAVAVAAEMNCVRQCDNKIQCQLQRHYFEQQVVLEGEEEGEEGEKEDAAPDGEEENKESSEDKSENEEGSGKDKEKSSKSKEPSELEKLLTHKTYMMIIGGIAASLLLVCLCVCCWVRSKTAALEKKTNQLLEQQRAKKL